MAMVGDISKEQAIKSLKGLEEKWPPKEVTMPVYPLPEPRESPAVYFVDVPNAKQSYIQIGNLALAYDDPDYYPAYVMNYKLGGSFNSIVNMILREEKGYTYGARTRFSGYHIPGTFSASSSVQSRVTLESVQIFKDSLTNYREGISAEDLEFTKSALVKSNARRFETLGALLSMLNTMVSYDLPPDYIKQQEKIVRDMTIDRHKQLAQQYINPDRMIYLIVGDAASQMELLERLGLGKPVFIENK
jgi:zinc protease